MEVLSPVASFRPVVMSASQYTPATSMTYASYENTFSRGSTSIDGTPAGVNTISKKNYFDFTLESPSMSNTTLDNYLKAVLGGESNNSLPDMLTKPYTLSENQSNSSSSSQISATKDNQIRSVRTDVTKDIRNDNLDVAQKFFTEQASSTGQSKTMPPPSVLNGNDFLARYQQSTILQNQRIVQATVKSESNAIAENQAVCVTTEAIASNQIVPHNTCNDIETIQKGQIFMDITEYLNMPQSEAAKKLGVPPSTLSKRWKEAARDRKWPFRLVSKIDKEIITLLHNVPQGFNTSMLSDDIEIQLGALLRKRQEELRPVIIRV